MHWFIKIHKNNGKNILCTYYTEMLRILFTEINMTPPMIYFTKRSKNNLQPVAQTSALYLDSHTDQSPLYFLSIVMHLITTCTTINADLLLLFYVLCHIFLNVSKATYFKGKKT